MTDTAADIDLDALIDRLLERAAERAGPLLNVEGQDVEGRATAGRVSVNPGDIVASNWGNLVYGQSVNVFASSSDRDTQWPTPADGAVCYTVAETAYWYRIAGVWQRAPAMPYCHVYQTTAQAIPAATVTVVNFDTTEAGSGWDVTNHRYPVPLTGRYLVNTSVMASGAVGAGGFGFTEINKNGTRIKRGATSTWNGTNNPSSAVSATIPCAAGDFLSVSTDFNLAANTFTGGVPYYTWAQFTWIGP